jgi:hypothetical protein
MKRAESSVWVERLEGYVFWQRSGREGMNIQGRQEVRMEKRGR